jgi:hypothetical protein
MAIVVGVDAEGPTAVPKSREAMPRRLTAPLASSDVLAGWPCLIGSSSWMKWIAGRIGRLGCEPLLLLKPSLRKDLGNSIGKVFESWVHGESSNEKGPDAKVEPDE